MRIHRLKRLIFVLAMSGCLFGQVNCLPSRNQLNATFNSGILSGIQLALTLGITNLLAPGLLDVNTGGTGGTGNTDTTATTP